MCRDCRLEMLFKCDRWKPFVVPDMILQRRLLAPKAASIVSLPPELHHQIFLSHLESPLDRLSLALTCAHLLLASLSLPEASRLKVPERVRHWHASAAPHIPSLACSVREEFLASIGPSFGEVGGRKGVRKWGEGGRSWGLCCYCGMWRLRKVGYWKSGRKMAKAGQEGEEERGMTKRKGVAQGKKNEVAGGNIFEGGRKCWVDEKEWSERVSAWSKGHSRQCPDCYCEEMKEEYEEKLWKGGEEEEVIVFAAKDGYEEEK